MHPTGPNVPPSIPSVDPPRTEVDSVPTLVPGLNVNQASFDFLRDQFKSLSQDISSAISSAFSRDVTSAISSAMQQVVKQKVEENLKTS